MLVEIVPMKDGKPVKYNSEDELPEIESEEEICGEICPVYLTLADCVYLSLDKNTGYKLELNKFADAICDKYAYNKIETRILSANLLTTIFEDELSTDLSELRDFFINNGEYIQEITTTFVWSHIDTE